MVLRCMKAQWHVCMRVCVPVYMYVCTCTYCMCVCAYMCVGMGILVVTEVFGSERMM